MAYWLTISGTLDEADRALSSRAFRKYKLEDASYKGQTHIRLVRAVLPDLPNYSLSLAKWLAEVDDSAPAPLPPGSLVHYAER